MYQLPKCPYLCISQVFEFNFRVLFPVSILKSNVEGLWKGKNFSDSTNVWLSDATTACMLQISYKKQNKNN